MVWKPRVTVAVVVRQNDRYLLVEENVRDQIVYNQPAGHLEPEESLVDAARRECLEETAYDVRIQHLVGVYQWRETSNNEHFIRFTFAADVISHDPTQILDDGIIACHWKSLHDIRSENLRLRSPMVLKNINDFESGISYPNALICSMGEFE